MVTEFEEGETYTNPDKYDQDVMILGIGYEDDEVIVAAILWVDRDTVETTSGDELEIPRSEFKNWTKVDL